MAVKKVAVVFAGSLTTVAVQSVCIAVKCLQIFMTCRCKNVYFNSAYSLVLHSSEETALLMSGRRGVL